MFFSNVTLEYNCSILLEISAGSILRNVDILQGHICKEECYKICFSSKGAYCFPKPQGGGLLKNLCEQRVKHVGVHKSQNLTFLLIKHNFSGSIPKKVRNCKKSKKQNCWRLWCELGTSVMATYIRNRNRYICRMLIFYMPQLPQIQK